MSADLDLEQIAEQEYKWGFVTDIESDSLPPGLDESTVKAISKKKEEPAFTVSYTHLTLPTICSV